MNYFLYTDSTSTTGKELLAKLKEAGVNIIGGTHGPNEGQKVGTLVRWGATKLVGKPGKVLNNAKSIGLASDKLGALEILKENDIRVPEFFKDSTKITQADFPVLGRKVHHVAGNDIVLALQRTDINDAKKLGCTYFTKYIPKSAEYRVHVFGGSAIKVSQKLLTQPELNKDPWIWNFDEGYTYHPAKDKLPAMAKMMALASVDALGLTFGAVDVIISDEGKPYILEVNTAPGLQTDSSLEAYVSQFKAAIS